MSLPFVDLLSSLISPSFAAPPGLPRGGPADLVVHPAAARLVAPRPYLICRPIFDPDAVAPVRAVAGLALDLAERPLLPEVVSDDPAAQAPRHEPDERAAPLQFSIQH
jgi:hypothetical protein